MLLHTHYNPEKDPEKLDYSSENSEFYDQNLVNNPVKHKKSDKRNPYRNWLGMETARKLKKKKYIFSLNKNKQFMADFKSSLGLKQKIMDELNDPLTADYMEPQVKRQKMDFLAGKETEQFGKLTGPAFPEKRKIVLTVKLI